MDKEEYYRLFSRLSGAVQEALYEQGLSIGRIIPVLSKMAQSYSGAQEKCITDGKTEITEDEEEIKITTILKKRKWGNNEQRNSL